MLLFILSEVEGESDQRFMIELYETHKARMFKIARSLVFESEFVEDIVQESLMGLMSNIETIKRVERCKLESYIVYTVKHNAYNHNRKMKREKSYLVFEEDDKLIRLLRTGDRSLEDSMTKTEQKEQVRMILRKLPKEDQDIIIRKYYLKQSDREIAEAHDLKADSVRMRLTRIRRKFFKAMNEEGITYEIT